jgi:hypothetical protein
MSIEDHKLTAEIVDYLNEKALDAVKGSEFGPDEHFFGLAAEIIQDRESLVNKIKELIEVYEERGLYGQAASLVDELQVIIKEEESGE